MYKFWLGLLLLCALEAAWSAPINIQVSLLPQKMLAERVGGSLVSVGVLVGRGLNPESYEPSPAQVASLASADLLILSGMPFEKVWLPRFLAVNPALQSLDLHQGLHLLEDDLHVWTDPLLLKQQAQQLARSLVGLRPEAAQEFSNNLHALEQELDRLDKDLRGKLTGIKVRAFLALHPAWGYFADRYQLQQLALEHHGKEFSTRQLAELADQVGRLGVRYLFTQPGSSQRVAHTLAAKLGLELRQADPLGEDYFAAMRGFASQLAGETP